MVADALNFASDLFENMAFEMTNELWNVSVSGPCGLAPTSNDAACSCS